MKALDDERFGNRTQALRHPNVNINHVKKALNDPEEFVRGLAHDVAKERGFKI